jgi:hypothetical protein
MSKSFCLILLFFVSSPLWSQVHWETMVKADEPWNYLIGDSEPPSGWYSPGFDDTSWPSARGSFGYGDGDDTTELSIAHSLYIRHTFTIADRAIMDSLILDIDYDDAFVAYLNGSVVARSFNVETDFPPYDYVPTIDQEARMYQGGQPSRIAIPKDLLLNGDNVLAIQGINMGPASSDFSLAPFLQVRLDAAGILYFELPDWFVDPDAVFESNLPIIAIETLNGQAIPDEPKIPAHMGIINSAGGINEYPGGIFNDYDGNIGIELRGASSFMFDKKGYGLETRLENGENNNVSVLGIPVENDWVLHGPYSDKSLIRNVLAYHFAAEMGQYAPRTRLCELFINHVYSGVYVLTEKIKKDTFRVDVGKLEPHETSGRDLTGGYIFKLDKGDEPYWVSPYPSLNNNEIRFLYHYPDPDLMPAEQKDYIKDFVTAFEDALAGDRFYDPVLGYKPYIDMQSFVDFYLVNELTKNVDAYRISTFLHKDKDKLDRVSPLWAGPVWDFNLGFGNADYYEASVTSGWQSNHPADYWSTPFWWNRLKEDPDYFNLMVDSWTGYRNTILSDARVSAVIDSLTTLLADAQQRNFNAFPILDRYVWPNNYVGGSYENEISYLKNWIFERMAWMDEQLDWYMWPYSTPGHAEREGLDLELYPNPVVSELYLHVDVSQPSELQVEVINALGQVSYRSEFQVSAGGQTLYLDAAFVHRAMSEPGMYYLNLYLNGVFVEARKIVKQ